MATRPPTRTGLTLLELVVVLAVLVAVAGIIVPLVSNLLTGPSIRTASGGDKSVQQIATEATMARVREAIMGSEEMPGYVADMGGWPAPTDLARADHPQLRYLFVNPATEDPQRDFDPNARRGWRGPYVLNATGEYVVQGGFTRRYGETGDPAILDGWGQPIVIQRPEDASAADPAPDRYVRLVSAGANGILETPADKEIPSAAECGDDLVLYLRISDPR